MMGLFRDGACRGMHSLYNTCTRMYCCLYHTLFTIILIDTKQRSILLVHSTGARLLVTF